MQIAYTKGLMHWLEQVAGQVCSCGKNQEIIIKLFSSASIFVPPEHPGKPTGMVFTHCVMWHFIRVSSSSLLVTHLFVG